MMSDAAMAPVWMAVNLFLLWAGWRASRLLMPEAGAIVRACQIALFWWAAVVLAAVTTGAAELLNGPALLVSGTLCGWVLLASAKRLGQPVELRPAAAEDSTGLAAGGWWFGERFWVFLWGSGWRGWQPAWAAWRC